MAIASPRANQFSVSHGSARRITGDALAIAIFSFVIHLAIAITVCLCFHISLQNYTDKGDGQSYKRMAATMLGNHRAMDDYDTRVFPGYPALIVTCHEITRLPINASSLFVELICAAIFPAIFALIYSDRHIGWALAILFPHAWINTSMAMSEAPMLAMLGIAIFAHQNKSGFLTGLFLGLAMMIRPAAAFAALGVGLDLLAQGRTRRLFIAIIASLLVIIPGIFLMRHLTGGALHGLHVYAHSPQAYDGSIFTWPFASILHMLFYGHVWPWRAVYILAHVALALGACGILAALVGSKMRGTDRWSLPWLLCNTAFILCLGLGPGAWGFNHFPRFMLPALPPVMYAWRRWLPRNSWIYIAASVGLFVMAIYAIKATP